MRTSSSGASASAHSRGGITVGVVDVEVREAAFVVESSDVLRRLGGRPAAIRLDVDRDLEPVARRLLLDEEQAVVLR